MTSEQLKEMLRQERERLDEKWSLTKLSPQPLTPEEQQERNIQRFENELRKPISKP